MESNSVYIILILIFELIIFMLEVESFEVLGSIYHENGSKLENEAQQGSNLILKCKGTRSYERCYWKHNRHECHFEWMRNALFIGGYLKKKYCGRYFTNKIIIQKEKYENHECSLLLKNVESSDEGDWSCQLEEYKFGSSKGNKGYVTLTLNVELLDESGYGYNWIVFIVGVIAGVFCVLLLVVWAYTNARKIWTCIKKDRNNQVENAEGSNQERSRTSNISSATNIELTQIPLSEENCMNNVFNAIPNTNQQPLPPKYEDIESHPIVEPYPLRTNNLDGGNPPKYEDVVHP